MKTYSTRTNAKRAAIKAGIPADEVELVTVKEPGEPPRFTFKGCADDSEIDTGTRAKRKAAPATKVKAKGVAPAKAAAQPVRAQREERNGVKRPAAGTLCGQVWAWCDQHPDAKLADAKAWGEKKGLNINNVSIEFYQHRKFHAKKETRKAA